MEIDVREKSRGDRAIEYYQEYEYETKISELLVGDYIFTDNNIKVIFEYKTIQDFISSVEDNRVFNQALNQSNQFDYHFVIIVGNEQETEKAVDEHGYLTGNWISLNGSIASLVEFTSVLQVKSENLAFDLMERIARKCTRDKPVIHRFNKSRGSPAYRLLVNNVNRVGEKTAELICLELGLNTIESVFRIGVEDLVSIKGIGEKTATNILNQIKKNYS